MMTRVLFNILVFLILMVTIVTQVNVTSGIDDTTLMIETEGNKSDSKSSADIYYHRIKNYTVTLNSGDGITKQARVANTTSSNYYYGPSAGVTAGASIGSVISVLILSGLIFCYYYYKQKKRT